MCRRLTSKIGVLGMVQRNGDIVTKVIPDAKSKTILPIIEKHVEKGTTISSDQYHTYKRLPGLGYKHGSVNHSIEQWVNGIHHTNTLEGFWSHLKKSILGTHIHVSNKHLSKYLGEFEYRYNMRANPSLMFDRFLVSF